MTMTNTQPIQPAREPEISSVVEDIENPPFVSQEDYRAFARTGRDLDACIAVFISEITAYFNANWREEFKITELPKSLEELNEKHLLNYPSTGGDAVLDDSFTGPECPIKMLTEPSFLILDHFYNMKFYNYSIDTEY